VLRTVHIATLCITSQNSSGSVGLGLSLREIRQHSAPISALFSKTRDSSSLYGENQNTHLHHRFHVRVSHARVSPFYRRTSPTARMFCSGPRAVCADESLARRRALIAVSRDCAPPTCNGAARVTAVDVIVYREDV